MSSASHRCSICKQAFSSRSHLKRHEATSHNSRTQVTCEFCGRKYSRQDALRRHYKSCSIGRQPLPKKAGRHRKSCDSCAKNRSTCNANLPCSSCETLGYICTYQRLAGHTGEPLGDTPITRVSTRSQHRQPTAILDQRRGGQLSVPFLLNYSAPNNQNNPGDVNHALSLLSTTKSNDQELDSALLSLEVEADRSDLFFDDSWALFFGSVTNERQNRVSPSPEGLDNPEQRHLAADKMIDYLSRVCASQINSFAEFDTDRKRTYFNERNVRDFINAYFDHTVRPRSRIVLKSSFNLETTSAPLLLAIFLLGASYGLSDHAKSQAKIYIDMAEQAVFEDPHFLRLVYHQQSRDVDNLNLIEIESVQAAVLIILNQLASPKPEARRRVRIQRYSALVSIARATSMTKIKNQWHDSNIPLSHAEFIKNETCIRLMASITMLDCHNIMFFNTPPQFTASEFEFDLPAEENGIDIRDSSSWEIWAQSERKQQRPSPLNIFVQELLSDDWPGLDDPRYSNLNVFALFIVVSAFQPIIFGLRSSLCNMSDATHQLDRALSRWMGLWERLKARLSQQEIYRAGITYHAPDLCVYARLVLRKPLSETGEIAQDSMAQIHQLLKKPLQ